MSVSNSFQKPLLEKDSSLTQREIPEQLECCHSTVRNHLGNAWEKGQ